MRLTIEKVSILKNAKIFCQIPEDILAEIARVAETMFFKVGETIIAGKTEVNSLYVIAEGMVEIHKDSPEIKKLSKNDSIIETTVISPKQSDFVAIATEETELIKLSNQNLLKIIFEHPKIAYWIMQSLCNIVEDLESVNKS